MVIKQSLYCLFFKYRISLSPRLTSDSWSSYLPNAGIGVPPGLATTFLVKGYFSALVHHSNSKNPCNLLAYYRVWRRQDSDLNHSQHEHQHVEFLGLILISVGFIQRLLNPALPVYNTGNWVSEVLGYQAEAQCGINKVGRRAAWAQTTVLTELSSALLQRKLKRGCAQSNNTS
jgi:hypothetical protein